MGCYHGAWTHSRHRRYGWDVQTFASNLLMATPRQRTNHQRARLRQENRTPRWNLRWNQRWNLKSPSAMQISVRERPRHRKELFIWAHFQISLADAGQTRK